jgi:catalase
LAVALDWLRMAFAHLKVIGHVPEAAPLFDAAHVDPNADDGLVLIKNAKVADFIEAAKRHRIWEREPSVR